MISASNDDPSARIVAPASSIAAASDDVMKPRSSLLCDVGSSGLCRQESKLCPSSIPQTTCSGHGSCSYSDYNGQPTLFCLATDELCQVICTCSPGYAGEACQWTESEKEELSSARLLLLSSVRDVQNAESNLEVARTSVVAQANVVKNLVSLSDELDRSSVTLAVGLLSNIAEASLLASSEFAEEVNLNIATAVSSLLDAEGTVQNSSVVAQVDSIVENVAVMELQNIVEGEEASEIVTNNLKMSSIVVPPSALATTSFQSPGKNVTRWGA